MDKFPLTMIVLVKFEKIVVEKSEKKIRINKLFLYIFSNLFYLFLSII